MHPFFLIVHWIKPSSKERGGEVLGSAETDDVLAASSETAYTNKSDADYKWWWSL